MSAPKNNPNSNEYWQIDWAALTEELNQHAPEWATTEMEAGPTLLPRDGEEAFASRPYFLVLVGMFFRVPGYTVTPTEMGKLYAAQAGDAQAAIELRERQAQVLATMRVSGTPGLSFVEAWVRHITELNGEAWVPTYMPMPLQRLLRVNPKLRTFYHWLGAAENYYE